MPDEIKVVLDEMKKTTEAMHQYVDRKIEEVRKSGGNGDPTTLESIEKANNDITELRKQYDELLVVSQRPANVTAEGDDPEKLLIRSAFEKFIRYGAGENANVQMSPEEKRALSNSADVDGGFLVPIDFESTVIMNAYEESAIRPVVGARPTSRDTVFMPALAKPVVSWGVNGLAVSAQDLAAGGHTLSIHDLKALTLIHNNTLEDADADIWGELSGAFSSAIAESEDNAFAVGTGVNSPQGILTNAAVAANFTLSGVSGALVDATHNGIDACIAALYKLKATYRRNASFAFNSGVEAILRTAKDTSPTAGQYLWQPPVQAGAPATLLGKPIINPEGMPASTTAGLLPIIVGDFGRGYKIRDRKGITVNVLLSVMLNMIRLVSWLSAGQVVKLCFLKHSKLSRSVLNQLFSLR